MKPWRVIRGSPLLLWELVAAAVRASESRAGAELRRWLYRTDCHVDTHVHITNARNFACGVGCALYHGTYVLNGEGTLQLGDHSHLGAYCYVNAQHGAVRIGDHVAVGPGTKILAYSNHYARGRKVTEERRTADVSIGNNVFIGANCTVLPGTVVPDNVVLAAGCVARGELRGDAIYGGVPCRLIREGWH
jgi:acetyltransferase-like isoleucine patch superfamily enzyme